MTKPQANQALYRRLKLPLKSKRPYFYTNFVQSVDGVVQSRKHPRAYWPLGSQRDFATLLELRAHADVLIHGRNTALNSPTLQRLTDPDFQKRRKQLGKHRPLLYIVVSTQAQIIQGLRRSAPAYTAIQQVKDKNFSAKKLSAELYRDGYHHILVEGGPQLVQSFVQAKLLDELFLTIAPKLLGSEKGNSLHLLEGSMFQPKRLPQLKLIAQKELDSELFLRYRIQYPR